MLKFQFLRIVSVLILIYFGSFMARADVPGANSAAKILTERIGNYRALSSTRPGVSTDLAEHQASHDEARKDARDLNAIGSKDSAAGRMYGSGTGEKFFLQLTKTSSDSHAYALLTNRGPELGKSALTETVSFGELGTASITVPGRVLFCKGSVFVVVSGPDGETGEPAAMVAFARAFADTLPAGENSVPVLVQHLPDWQNAKVHAAYSVTLEGLKASTQSQPVLDSLSFEGGAEAVVANYGPSQFVIVEFTTPQLASDNDSKILAKIQELRNQAKPVPTAYRRVGNYAVFVFNAPNEQTANQLIEQVKYEQVVQWLGDNPYWLRDAQRRYTETMLGTFVSVVKASGLAAVLCFGIGGFFGALLFTRRRAQQAAQRAYSDAGGMMRLNIDELSAETDPSRLLGPGKN